MSQQKDAYGITRKCFSCGHEENALLAKREAAFMLANMEQLFGPTCKKCSSTSFGREMEFADLDLALLVEWATNDSLRVLDQDEDVILAKDRYVDMILYVLDTVNMSDYKRNVLMEALCVLVYDNSEKDGEEFPSPPDTLLKARVIEELKKRRDKPFISGIGNEMRIQESIYDGKTTVMFSAHRSYPESVLFVYTNDPGQIQYYDRQVDLSPNGNRKIKENWYRIIWPE